MTDFRPMSKRMVDARPEEVDQVIGKRRVSAVSTTVDWSECGLAKRFPAWEAFLESLAVERVTAKKEGRAPHPRAAAPLLRPMQLNRKDQAPWEETGLTASRLKPIKDFQR